MNNKAKRRVMVLLALFTLLLSACGNPAKMSGEDSKTAAELGAVFAEDISQAILRYREAPERLESFGYVVYDNERLLGADHLAKFYIEYDDGMDTGLTIVFADSGFVASRLVFKDGKGFYLRYEYSRLQQEDVMITARLVDGVTLKYFETPPKWEMNLFFGKKQIAGFSFQNPEQ